jgi:hypothetical protein
LAEHLFLLNFLILAARPISSEGRLSAASENRGTALLVSGHHRMRNYELQQTVTILQQVIAPLKALGSRTREPVTRQGGQPRITGISELPKACATVGAFSLLTLASKLAQY